MVKIGTVSSKGQVTIPIEIRKRLGLREGDRVEFAVERGTTILRPARGRDSNPFEAYVGALGEFPGGIAGINRWISEMRSDDRDAD